MEILFFYIEEYLGIKKQGYNLGSDYLFAIKEGKLEIAINDDFVPIVENWGNNDKNSTKFLNISALVGENGSGKSLSLEALRIILSQETRREFIDYFLVYRLKTEEGKLRLKYSTNLKIKVDSKELEEKEIPKNLFEVIFYTPILNPAQSFDYKIIDDIDVSVENLIEEDYDLFEEKSKENIAYEGPLLPFKYSNSKRHSELLHREDVIEYLIDDLFKVDIADGEFIAPNFIRKSDFAKSNNSSLYDNLSCVNGDLTKNIYKAWIKEKRANDLKSNIKRSKYIINDFKLALIMAFIHHLNKENNYLEELVFSKELYTKTNKGFQEVFELIKKGKLRNRSGKLLFRLGKIFDPLIDAFEELLKNVDWKKTKISKGDENYIEAPFKSSKKVQDEYNYFQRKIEDLNNRKAATWLTFESTKGLSTGEKAYLDFFSRIYVGIRKVFNRHLTDESKSNELTVLLIIDEGDQGFHLRWQKAFIDKCLKILPKLIKISGLQLNIQLLFTTHSPITLSDLPSTNITYLCNDDNGLIKAFQKLNSYTLGANIQNLLSDSFFMDEGTIGSFSRSIIEQITIELKNISISQDRDDELLKLVKQIGDPILRDRLEDLYRNKYGTVKSLRQELEDLDQKRKEIQLLLRKGEKDT